MGFGGPTPAVVSSVTDLTASTLQHQETLSADRSNTTVGGTPSKGFATVETSLGLSSAPVAYPEAKEPAPFIMPGGKTTLAGDLETVNSDMPPEPMTGSKYDNAVKQHDAARKRIDQVRDQEEKKAKKEDRKPRTIEEMARGIPVSAESRTSNNATAVENRIKLDRELAGGKIKGSELEREAAKSRQAEYTVSIANASPRESFVSSVPPAMSSTPATPVPLTMPSGFVGPPSEGQAYASQTEAMPKPKGIFGTTPDGKKFYSMPGGRSVYEGSREFEEQEVARYSRPAGITNMPTMTTPSSSRSSAMSGSSPPVSASASAIPMNPMTEEMRKSFREINPEDVPTIDFLKTKMDYGAISKMFGDGFAEVAKTAVKIALEEVLKSRQ
jgi:hypothetical protein